MNRIITIVLPDNATGNLKFLGTEAYRASGDTGQALATDLQTRLNELGFDATIEVFQDPAKVPAMTLVPKEYCDTLRAAIKANGLQPADALDCELAGALAAHLVYEDLVGGRSKAAVLDDLEGAALDIAERCPSIPENPSH